MSINNRRTVNQTSTIHSHHTHTQTNAHTQLQTHTQSHTLTCRLWWFIGIVLNFNDDRVGMYNLHCVPNSYLDQFKS